eukprot:3938598-Rhodomonas_salina.1
MGASPRIWFGFPSLHGRLNLISRHWRAKKTLALACRGFGTHDLHHPAALRKPVLSQLGCSLQKRFALHVWTLGPVHADHPASERSAHRPICRSEHARQQPASVSPSASAQWREIQRCGSWTPGRRPKRASSSRVRIPISQHEFDGYLFLAFVGQLRSSCKYWNRCFDPLHCMRATVDRVLLCRKRLSVLRLP